MLSRQKVIVRLNRKQKIINNNLKYMPLTPRNKQLIITAVIIAIIVLGAWLGYEQYQAVAAQQKDVATVNNELESAQQELKNLQKLSDSMNSMSVEINNVRQVLPASEDIPDLLANLEAISVYSGVTFDSVAISSSDTVSAVSSSAEEVAVPSGVKRLNLAVSVSGGYGNLKRYLHGVEQNMRLIDVNSISMGEGSVYNLNMQTYYVD